jgi:hypothetical protein
VSCPLPEHGRVKALLSFDSTSAAAIYLAATRCSSRRVVYGPVRNPAKPRRRSGAAFHHPNGLADNQSSRFLRARS